MDDIREVGLKRLSLQIAAQLPEDPQDAKKVLDYAKEIVEWQAGNLRTHPKPHVVVSRRVHRVVVDEDDEETAISQATARAIVPSAR